MEKDVFETTGNSPPTPQDQPADPESETSLAQVYLDPASLRPHPLALEFEPDPDPAFDKSIAESGVRVPLVVMDEGVVLDGLRRLRAAQKAGLRTVPALRYLGHDPFRFVIDLNINRRHLNTGQRAMIAAKLANMRQGERTDQEPFGNSEKVSQERAAELMNVSVDSVSTATQVMENALDLVPNVQTGRTSLNKAGKQARARKKAKKADRKPESKETREPKGKSNGLPPNGETPEERKKIEAERTAWLEKAHQEARAIIANEVAAFAERALWCALGNEQQEPGDKRVIVPLRSARLDADRIMLEQRRLYSNQRPVIRKDGGIEQAFRLTVADFRAIHKALGPEMALTKALTKTESAAA